MKSISLLLVLVSVMLYFTGCIPSKFDYLHDTTDISKIEVVEFAYVDEAESGSPTTKEVTLATVSDIDDFVSRLSDIPYRYMYNDILYFPVAEKCVAFKISYSNGDYEVFDSNHKVCYYNETQKTDTNVGMYEFKVERFIELQLSYLSNDKAMYTLMHDSSKVSCIDFVTAIDLDDATTYEVVFNVKNIDEFIKDQQSITYLYDLIYDATEESIHSGDKAFRITYSNGDYEIFNQTARLEVHKRDNQKHFVDTISIGRFDPAEYAAFEAKYAGN